MHARFAPAGTACGAGGRGISLSRTGYPLPVVRWKRQGLPRSQGIPIVPMPCSSTPAGLRTSGHFMMPQHGPRQTTTRTPTIIHFRGSSIAWPEHWLSTLRGPDYSGTTPDSLPVVGHLYRTGLITRRVPSKGFSVVLPTTCLPPFLSLRGASFVW